MKVQVSSNKLGLLAKNLVYCKKPSLFLKHLSFVHNTRFIAQFGPLNQVFYNILGLLVIKLSFMHKTRLFGQKYKFRGKIPGLLLIN